MKKRELERRLSESDRLRLFKRLGFRPNGHAPDSEGRVTGVLGPPELGEGENGNFSVNLRTGAVKDHGSTGYTGDLYAAAMDVRGLGFSAAVDWVAEQAGIQTSGDGAATRGKVAQPAPRPQPTQETPESEPKGIARKEVEAWSTALLDGEKGAHRRARKYLIERRGIDPKLLRSRRVGLRYDKLWWIVFPLAVESGRVTLRKERGFDPGKLDWLRDDSGEAFIRTKGGGSCLVVMAREDTGGPLLLCAGETDAFSARSNGWNVAFGSAGEGTFKPIWAREIAGLPIAERGVVVCYDGDAAGRGDDPTKPKQEGRKKPARMLAAEGVGVRVAELPDGADVNDVLTPGEGGPERLREIVSDATPYQAEAEREPRRPRAEESSHAAPSIITAEDLMQTTFPPPRWAVPGLLAEGLTLLAGKPKIGKSFLCLNIGLAVAQGGRALGKIGVEAGDALYLALEDSPRRLKERLDKMLGSGAAPERFSLATDWPRMDGEEGGLRHLSNWLSGHPDARLVIVDTFGKARQAPDGRKGVYYDEYEAGGLMKDVADEHGVALLVIHHTNKLTNAQDPFDMISGSTGLVGVADTAAVMKRDRTEADAVLHVAGRDVDASEWAMRFDPHVFSWTVKGDAADFRLSRPRREIVEALRAADGEVLGPKEIAEATGQKYSSVSNLLSKLADDGTLRKEGYGKYALPTAPDETDETHEKVF